MSFLTVGSNHLARVALLFALLFSASAAHAGRFLYTGGHGLDNARIAALGHTYSEFPADDAGWTAALSGAYGPFDAIVVGENSGYTPLSLATTSAIASHVSSGGRVIVASDHNGNTGFINAIFGYATTLAYGCFDDDSVAGSLQPGAVGTSFAGGPTTVGNLSCTSALNSTSVPAAARTMYAGPGTALAFAADYGSGKVVWLGWDYCCGGSVAQNDDWYLVLDNSIKFSGLFSTCAAQGFIGAKLTLCRQVCEIKQSPTALVGLTKLYTTIYRAPPPCSAAAVLRPPVAFNPSQGGFG